MVTPRANIVAWPVLSRHSSPTRPSSAIQISVSPSRCAGTGTLRADTIASTTVFAVSIAISVPMSGFSVARPCPFFGLSSSTMALEPVTDTMRPSDLSLAAGARVAPGMVNCMSAVSLTMRAPDARHHPERSALMNGKLTSTDVPMPFWLLILSSPPCNLTSALAIGSPSPVPSRQRAWLAST